MATSVGTVAELWRFPVKSMLGERLQQADLTEKGVVGDRQFAIVDDETGKIVSVKRPRRWGRMFEITASTEQGTVKVSLPDGSALAVDDPALPARLSELFDRPVSVASSPPPDAGYDEAWVRELKDGVAPYLGMESELIDGEEFIDGGAFMRANQNFFDFGALHIVATSSTNELAVHGSGGRFEPRRFRPNIVIDGPDVGFVESEWQGRTLTIGPVRLVIGIPVPRCVMTTLAQGDLPFDRQVLRTITAANSIDLLGGGTRYPCLGSYADVAVAGQISVGDPVIID